MEKYMSFTAFFCICMALSLIFVLWRIDQYKGNDGGGAAMFVLWIFFSAPLCALIGSTLASLKLLYY